MKKAFGIISSYWLEITLGAIFLACGIRVFLFYFLIIFLITAVRLTDHIRRLIRAYQVANEIKMLAIIRKLKISDEEVSIVLDGEKSRIGEEKWKEMEKDLKESTN